MIIKKHSPYIFEVEEAANEQYNIEINKGRHDTFGDYNQDMSKNRSASEWNTPQQQHMNYLRVEGSNKAGRQNSRSMNDTLDKTTQNGGRKQNPNFRYLAGLYDAEYLSPTWIALLDDVEASVLASAIRCD